VWFNDSGYSAAGRQIYDIAKEMNEAGHYFPLWGTCLGFELLAYLSANNTEIRAKCNSNSQALPLEFKEDFRSSRLFAEAPESIINILKNEPVTANFHSYCITEKVS
jgi:gamma-glutamyl hydrolase